MLLKNGKEFTPPKRDFENFKKTAIFKLASRFTKPSINKHNKKNRRPDAPRSFSIEPFFNYTDPKEKVVVSIKYFEQVQARSDGNVNFNHYTPDELNFEQVAQIIVEKNSPDLWWFLYNHPRQATIPYKHIHFRSPRGFP